MTTTTDFIHYAGGTNVNALCGKTSVEIQRDSNMITIFSSEVNCPACLREIDRLRDLGFVPKR